MNIIDCYKSVIQCFKAMGRPGVTFTPEQQAKIDNFMKIKDSINGVVILHGGLSKKDVENTMPNPEIYNQYKSRARSERPTKDTPCQ